MLKPDLRGVMSEMEAYQQTEEITLGEKEEGDTAEPRDLEEVAGGMGASPPGSVVIGMELWAAFRNDLAETKGLTAGLFKRFEETVCGLDGSVAALGERLALLEEATRAIADQVAFLPPQVRAMGNKIDSLSTTIGESRYRALLLSLLSVYDLVDQLLRSIPADAGDDDGHRRNYEVLRTQLAQFLEANGLTEISTEGVFDPTIHRAVQRVPCEDPKMANRVTEVVRPGFRTEQSILRYAEVTVGHYAQPEEAVGDTGTTAAPISEE